MTFTGGGGGQRKKREVYKVSKKEEKKKEKIYYFNVFDCQDSGGGANAKSVVELGIEWRR